jgi:hypothetical protein
MRPNASLGFENEHLSSFAGEPPSDRQPYDARANDNRLDRVCQTVP